MVLKVGKQVQVSHSDEPTAVTGTFSHLNHVV